MQWQDWVFSIGNWIFIFALIPRIRRKDKPQLSTSVITGTVLAVFAVTFLTLELWISTFSTVLASGCWFILAYQKYRQNKK
ncbi:hypothetical protein HYU92_05155 [Candidatus Curtissbacteria bacterium]|nr:hypothetical protein [Candidatus Curtissbacteria bacterium]